MLPNVLPVFTQPSRNNHRYQVIQRLGGGAMGAVFLAQDEQQRRAAIKLPAMSSRWRAEYVRRVWKEIQILSKLQHPNIIEIHDWGQEEQLGPYIVMEYIEGGSVLQLMMQNQPPRLNPLEALRITAAVADALAYAHALRPPIIHRDIKPDNVLIRRSDGQVKVSDFGLAAVMERGRAMTQWGTPDYIAPEQALGRGADGRSDLYALAATLYHMLTGVRPPSSVMAQPPPRPSANMMPGVLQIDQARRLDYLIFTLMQYDPINRRPAPDRKSWHAVDVAEELRAIAERRPARLYPGPENSMIFPKLMTGMIPPPGAPQPRPAPVPAPQTPAAPQLFQAPPAPPLPQAEQIVPFQAPAPRPGPSGGIPVPPPAQAFMPPQQHSPSGGIPVPPPAQAFMPPQQHSPSGGIPAPAVQPPPQQHGPSGGIPAPAPQPAISFQAVPPAVQMPAAPARPPQPSAVLPPAIQVRPAPQAAPSPPPAAAGQPSAGAAAPSAAVRTPVFSAGEKELLAGVLIAVLGVVALLVIDIRLPSDVVEAFAALTRGLILWGAGLLTGLASPGGRRGRFPLQALLIAGLALAVGFPLVQLLIEGQAAGAALEVFSSFSNILDWLLLSLPFLLLGAVATWLAMKVLGKDGA